MPFRASRSALLGAVAVLALPALAAAQEPCATDLRQLDERIAGLQNGAVTPAATKAELDGLRGYREAAHRLAAFNPAVCAALVKDALAAARALERPGVLETDRLADASLKDAQGQDMGAIEELVVDPVSGRIAYGVVELGGFLGIGERYFPVPWALFEPAADGQTVVLHAERDRLTAAPQFTSGNRPDMTDRNWALALHTYYNVAPYWLDGGSAFAAFASASPAASPAAAPAAAPAPAAGASEPAAAGSGSAAPQ